MSLKLTNLRNRSGDTDNPWSALWALLVGFFMILVDATIVVVANPSIMAKLGASYDAVIWVTSAYLLAYAVPLLVAGRLGDRFGPKNLYLAGLAVFTAASLWCGLADSIGMLIAARVVQGVGAAMLTPQTLSTITRIFPAERRGVAMSLWGATAGVATLVGPLAGGVLVDGLGWQWIFFVNVPVGIIGFAFALWLVPALPTHKQRFDLVGVALSGLGMFMIVFALQEGQSHDWAPWVWGMIAGGIGFMAAFLVWQSVNPNDPLVPLGIFGDRDFTLANIGVATIGFVVTAMMVPTMFYAQAVCGLSPTRSAVLIAPMAIASGVLAPFVGKIVDRSHPRPVIGFGFSVAAIAMTWLSIEMTPTTPIWRLVLPLTAVGVGMAFIWSPLTATATRNLPSDLAGAGSGVYSATRQVGTVLGSAGVAAFMTWRISSLMPPGAAEASQGDSTTTQLPSWLHEPFAAAMSQTMLLPAFFALFGIVAALFLLGFGDSRTPVPVDTDDDDERASYAVDYGGDESFVDDDEYVEYTVNWDEPEPVLAKVHDLEAVTEPVITPRIATDHHRQPSGPEADGDSWRNILDALLADHPPAPVTPPAAEPIGFAHNGFHTDDESLFRRVDHRDRLAEPKSTAAEAYTADIPAGGEHAQPPRHRTRDPQPEPRQFWFESNGRHSREDVDDSSRRGRHSTPWRD